MQAASLTSPCPIYLAKPTCTSGCTRIVTAKARVLAKAEKGPDDWQLGKDRAEDPADQRGGVNAIGTLDTGGPSTR